MIPRYQVKNFEPLRIRTTTTPASSPSTSRRAGTGRPRSCSTPRATLRSFPPPPTVMVIFGLSIHSSPVNWYLERWLHLSGNALKQVTTWHLLKVQVLHWQKLSVENHINPTYHCFLTGPSSLESIILIRFSYQIFPIFVVLIKHKQQFSQKIWF